MIDKDKIIEYCKYCFDEGASYCRVSTSMKKVTGKKYLLHPYRDVMMRNVAYAFKSDDKYRVHDEIKDGTVINYDIYQNPKTKEIKKEKKKYLTLDFYIEEIAKHLVKYAILGLIAISGIIYVSIKGCTKGKSNNIELKKQELKPRYDTPKAPKN